MSVVACYTIVVCSKLFENTSHFVPPEFAVQCRLSNHSSPPLLHLKADLQGTLAKGSSLLGVHPRR
eukprot:TRINITY_DN2082_c0_g1_i3.p1 TRINITY_DN2082_c0_g1~~TRINITY_DN2082_c0_g1_i3.p1  ORF type:complete len:66 (+),score=3.67 TRINITY_DN2082_c0_g1_i3:155-352(+)